MKNHSERFLRIVEDAKTNVREVTAEDVRARLEAGAPFHLIDVREDREWNEGRLPHALHIGKGVIERDIEKHVPDDADEIVLYCGGGFRSAAKVAGGGSSPSR